MSKIAGKYTVTTSGCWNWTGSVSSRGYGRLAGIGSHRISYVENFGSIPNGMMVCHRCDNRLCVNPAHLFLGTAQDNTNDMMTKGRHVTVPLPGTSNGMSKLSEADVVGIYTTPINGAEAARRFNTTPENVHSIRSGKTWRHVTKNLGAAKPSYPRWRAASTTKKAKQHVF